MQWIQTIGLVESQEVLCGSRTLSDLGLDNPLFE